MKKVNDSSLKEKEFDIGRFSRKNIQTGVIKLIFQHGSVLWPLGVGLVSLFGGFLIAKYFFAIFSICLFLAAGGFIVNYFFREDCFSNKYMEMLQKQIDDNKREKLRFLEEEFERFKSVNGVEDFCKQSLHQFGLIRDKFQIFQNFLSGKLNEGELTFSRYLGASKQIYLSILDNLTEISNLLKSIACFDDGDYLKKRVWELRKNKSLNETDQKELKTIEERLGIREGQIEKINILITENEEAITQFDRALIAVNDIKKKGMAEVDMDTALQELEKIAKSCRRYSV